MIDPVAEKLREHGIQPSKQRLAVARFVLATGEHPSADQVLEHARAKFPSLSRATVYNTLHLFVEKGLLRELAHAGGRAVYDPNVGPHHHFIDEATGRIHDVPWDAVRADVRGLKGYEVSEYSVVMRGKKRR